LLLRERPLSCVSGLARGGRPLLADGLDEAPARSAARSACRDLPGSAGAAGQPGRLTPARRACGRGWRPGRPGRGTGPAGPAVPWRDRADLRGPRARPGTGMQLKGSVPTFSASANRKPASRADAYIFRTRDDTALRLDCSAVTWINAVTRSRPCRPCGSSLNLTDRLGRGCWRRWPKLALLASGHPGVAGVAWRRWQPGSRGTGWLLGTRPPPLAQIAARSLVIHVSRTPSLERLYQLGAAPAVVPVGDLPSIGLPVSGWLLRAEPDSQSAKTALATHDADSFAQKGAGMSKQQTKTSNTASSGATAGFDGFANSEAANQCESSGQSNGRGGLTIAVSAIGTWPALYELEILYRRFNRASDEGIMISLAPMAYAVPPSDELHHSSPGIRHSFHTFRLGGAEAFFRWADEIPRRRVQQTKLFCRTGITQTCLQQARPSPSRRGRSARLRCP